MTTEINFADMDAAIRHYEALGYECKDVPWQVSLDAYSMTKPENSAPLSNFGAPFPVASGEQSLIERILDGFIDVGRYVCVTPCFRPWDPVDSTHRKEFYKVELMHYLDQAEPNQTQLASMIDHAKTFMATFVSDLRVVETTDEPRVCCKTIKSFDIMNNDLELGSYGIRHSKYIGYWIYGTGLALPRIYMAKRRTVDV